MAPQLLNVRASCGIPTSMRFPFHQITIIQLPSMVCRQPDTFGGFHVASRQNQLAFWDSVPLVMWLNTFVAAAETLNKLPKQRGGGLVIAPFSQACQRLFLQLGILRTCMGFERRRIQAVFKCWLSYSYVCDLG